jgi:hypothetical protein
MNNETTEVTSISEFLSCSHKTQEATPNQPKIYGVRSRHKSYLNDDPIPQKLKSNSSGELIKKVVTNKIKKGNILKRRIRQDK